MTQVKKTHTPGSQGPALIGGTDFDEHCGLRLCVNVCVVPPCDTGAGVKVKQESRGPAIH